MSEDVHSQLFSVVRAGDVTGVQVILREHPELLHFHHGFNTWLHIAAAQDKLPMVEFLVRAGINVNVTRAADPDTPLDSAAMSGSVMVALWLLDQGARIRPTTSKEGGTLIGAVNSGSLELVRLLLERGADVNGSYGSPARNALNHAIDYGYTAIADLLRSHGAILPVLSSSESARTRNEIIAHFEKHFGTVAKTGVAEIVPGEVAVWVQLVPARADRDVLTLFTTGMSDRALTVPPGREDDRHAELVIHLPREWPVTLDALADRVNSWPIDWLRRGAHYMHEQQTWIGPGYGVLVNGDPPEPLAPGIRFDSLLLLGQGNDFGRFRIRDGLLIRINTVYPLYPTERVFEQSQGVVRLLERLRDHSSFPLVDVYRKPVVD